MILMQYVGVTWDCGPPRILATRKACEERKRLAKRVNS